MKINASWLVLRHRPKYMPAALFIITYPIHRLIIQNDDPDQFDLSFPITVIDLDGGFRDNHSLHH